MLSFSVQNILSLTRSCFFFFLFLLPQESDPRKYHRDSCYNIQPMFSSKSFMVSDLAFRSLNHFGFDFCILCEGMF